MPGGILRQCVRGAGAFGMLAALGWPGAAFAQVPSLPILPPIPPSAPTTAVARPPAGLPQMPAMPLNGFGIDPGQPASGLPIPIMLVQAAPPPTAPALPSIPTIPVPTTTGAAPVPAGVFSTDVQNAPGGDPYGPTPDLYSTILREAASTVPGVSSVPIADYAPRGYFPRDQQNSPAVPEFARVEPPLAVTPEERQRYVTRGLAPGSLLVPGSNTSFRARGFVRLTGMYDFNPIRSRDDFVTNTIPVPRESGQNMNFTARPSRITLESWTPTSFRDWNVHTFIEGDFFNGPAQAVGGGGNPFRLRFAFVDFGYFRVGQQNTVFMDAQTWPSLVDFAGPRGWVNQRRPGIRMTVPLSEKFYWAAGIEQPFSDITADAPARNVQDVPDFATHLRYEADLGHAQVSALSRSIGYEEENGSVTRRGGWGLSAAGVYHPWAALLGTNPVTEEDPSGLTRSRVIGQYTFGKGIARYIQDTAGLGLDGQVDRFNDSFALPYVAGWLVSYEHWFNAKWLSSVTYSAVLTGNTPAQPADTYTSARYLAANVWFIPIRSTSIGAEYLYGRRQNLDTQNADAHRIQLLFQYNF